MTLTQRALWVALASTLVTTAFAQNEPYYIPSTAPTTPDTAATPPYSTPSVSTPSAPVYATPPEANTGRPASSDSSRPLIGAPSAELPIYTYTQAGTQGLGIGVGMKLNPSWVIRAEVNGLNLNRDFSKGSNSYSGKAKLRSEGIYADYYPMDNGFRVTGGLMFNQTKLTGDANLTGSSVVYNGTTYAVAAGETVSATVKSSPVLPYLGIGYGHDEADKLGFKFHADLGFAFGGKPDANVTLPASLAGNAQANADRQAEEQNLQDSFKTVPFVGKVQPVAEMGIGYTW